MSSRAKNLTRVLTALAVGLSATLSSLPVAQANPFTISYDANANIVGAVAQKGITTGSVPTSSPQASGTTYTVLGQGTLARQGFTFAGWNTSSTGTGTTYQPGSTFAIASSFTLFAIWTVPSAARLIGNGGAIINVANTNSVTNGSFCLSAGIRGITSDGTDIYFRPSTNPGYICRTTQNGVIVSVHLVTGLAAVQSDSLALVFGNGCLYLRKDSSTLNSIYCIAISNWSLNSISLPAGNPMPAGGGWLNGNFIQFPDGRIGSVGTSTAAASWSGGTGTGAGQCPTSMFCKTLRLYTPAGTGASTTLTYSADFVLADEITGWPSDDHGIATDGTYLYQIRHARGYKVWALQTTSPSFLVFNGDANGIADTTPACGATTGITATYCLISNPVNGAVTTPTALTNSTYFGRSHGLGKYLVGDYDGASRFWLSEAATPPPGPGNPDITPPSFTNSDTFTVTENIATSFNAATITINDSATLVIAAGNDGSLFNIIKLDTATAYLRFKASPDFEGPTDVGTNNIYNITITTTDSVGNAASRVFFIIVTNANESSITSAPVVVGDVYKGTVTTITVTVNAPGSVRFLLKGKKIPACLARPTSGNYPNYTATCQWKPPVTALQTLTAELTPSDSSFARSTSAPSSFWVLKRSTRR
ncbi:MAG: hypothetical protein F2602_00985 [Actinobacteria bacterium]|uniref:Unannotated protein n=1 Tax=freshwater metagenome TaxID=449393 RepID=A0A6J6BKI6_9ZZZZ|nr:hypothetical protein [Actinomycetota bacterium]MTA21037.1 hypothetical protein [Actinomycetota bacterium]